MRMRPQQMTQPRRQAPPGMLMTMTVSVTVLMAVIMNVAVAMHVAGIGAAGLRVAHNAQDARKTLLQHLNHSGTSAPASGSLFPLYQADGPAAVIGTRCQVW
jgi:hypothetical protein